MKRSLFLELMDEEAGIAKGGKEAFRSVTELGEMLRARAALVKKMDEAKAQGQLTQDQYDQLVALNRRHGLPQP